MPESPLIDSHAHIWAKGMPLIDKPSRRPAYEFTVEQYLATLDAHRVRYGVLAAASLFGTYNDYVIDAVRQHKRLRGTVVLDPSTDKYTIERMNEDGIVGVRLVWVALPEVPAVDSYEYRRLFRRIADVGWHIHLHVGLGRLPAILPSIEASGAKIVIDHFGSPDPALGVACPSFQAVLRSIDTGRTWVKLSAGYRVGRANARIYAAELMKTAGPERLVWGSDAPFAGFESETSYQQTLDDFVEWVPSEEARLRIGGETSLRLFFE